MSRTTFNFLWSPTPPWIYIGPSELEGSGWVPAYFYKHEKIEVCVRVLRGPKMHTTKALLNETSAALQLYKAADVNLYAFEDSLMYLDTWLSGDAYVIVINEAEELFKEESDFELSELLQTFHDVGEYWSLPDETPDWKRGPKPFHFLLNIDEKHSVARDRIMRLAATKGIPIRTHP